MTTFKQAITNEAAKFKGEVSFYKNFLIKNFMFLAVAAYVLLLVAGATTVTEEQRITNLNSLDQYVIFEQVDENTAICKNLSTGDYVTVDFNYNHFESRDLVGEGVKFEKFEWVGENHLKALFTIWG